eukprot:5905657-Prymnesium_polylepis.1
MEALSKTCRSSTVSRETIARSASPRKATRSRTSSSVLKTSRRHRAVSSTNDCTSSVNATAFHSSSHTSRAAPLSPIAGNVVSSEARNIWLKLCSRNLAFACSSGKRRRSSRASLSPISSRRFSHVCRIAAIISGFGSSLSVYLLVSRPSTRKTTWFQLLSFFPSGLRALTRFRASSKQASRSSASIVSAGG